MKLLVRYLRRHPGTAGAYAFCALLVIAGAFGPYLGPYSPVEASPRRRLQPPSAEHWFGTDTSGLDVFSRVIAAPRVDLTVAVLGVSLSLIVGVTLGLITGFYDEGVPGAIGGVILRVADMIQSFPVFILAMVLVGLLGQKIENVIYAVTFVNAPFYLRSVHAEVQSLRDRGFVRAARVSGVGSLAILRRHLLPNSLTPVLSQVSINIGWAILLTAGLSYVGAGVRAPTPEWGLMISQGARDVMGGNWWPALFPGLFLSLSVFSFALVGESLEVLLDPRRATAYEERERSGVSSSEEEHDLGPA